MEDGRPAGGAAGVDIGGGADDDAGDGQAAEQARDEVAGALSGEFLVEVRPLAAVQLIGGHGAQEGLHAGDDGEGEDGDDEHAPLRRQFQLGKGELLGQVDPLDVHLRDEGDDGPDHDGHQGCGDRPQAGPRQFLPKHQHADGHDTQDSGRRAEGSEASRQGDQIRDRRAGGRAAEQHVQLGEGDGDANTGQHAVHHRRGDDEGAARHLEVAEKKLHQAGAGGRETDGLPAQLLHESEDDDRQAGSRTGNLQRRAGQKAGDDAAGDGADQAGDHRCAGSQGDTQRKRDRHQEDDQGGGEVATDVHVSY